MRFRDFLAAIFAGRFVRFLTLSLLVLYFGPQIVGLVATLFRRHLPWVLALLIAVPLLWFLLRRGKARRKRAQEGTSQQHS
jgi:membrane protein DedA with SNARE-associated domain